MLTVNQLIGFGDGGGAQNSASGGTKTTSGAYTVHTLTNGQTFTALSTKSGATLEVDYLIVGGGGGGAADNSGKPAGGNAGQMLTGSMSLAMGAYGVTVGAGASGGHISGGPYDGQNGAASSFNGTSAAGGIGGDSSIGGTGNGGNLNGYNGNGAGSAGGAAGGTGGDGLSSDITGTARYYAAGGAVVSPAHWPTSDYVAGDGGSGGTAAVSDGSTGMAGTCIVRYLT